MKIIQNTLKIEEKFSDVPKKLGPKKVGSVGFPETRHDFLLPCTPNNELRHEKTNKMPFVPSENSYQPGHIPPV